MVRSKHPTVEEARVLALRKLLDQWPTGSTCSREHLQKALDKAQAELEGELNFQGVACDHQRMIECHPGCGHFYCPDCGLTWDDGCDFP